MVAAGERARGWGWPLPFAVGLALGAGLALWLSSPPASRLTPGVAALPVAPRPLNLRLAEDSPSGGGSLRGSSPAAEGRADLAALARIGTSPIRTQRFHAAGQAAGETDSVAELLQQILQIRAIDDRSEFVMGMIESLGKRSPQMAVELVSQLPASPVKSGAMAQALEYLAGQDPQQALAQVGQLAQGAELHNAMISIAEGWARQDPAAALQFALLHLDEQSQTPFLEAVASEWGKIAPEQALAQVAVQAPEENRLLLQGAILGTWSQTDPQAAFQWANAQPPGAATNAGLEIALLNWGAYDPASAAVALQQRQDAGLTSRVGSNLAGAWAREAPEQAFAFAQTLPADIREEALSGVFTSWADFDPRSALVKAMSLPEDNAARESGVDAALVQFLAANPTQFPSFVQTMPAALQGELRQRESQMLGQGPAIPAGPGGAADTTRKR